MPTDNRVLIQKADLALADLTTDGGILQPATAKKFMRLLIKESILLKLATVVPMSSYKQKLPKIKFGSRVLQAGTSGSALASGARVKPTTSETELNAQLFKAEVDLADEVLEDNIERAALQQTIMTLLTEAISRDMDEVIVQGDTGSGDAFLAKFNGLLAQATSHTVAGGSVNLSKTILRAMLKAMASEYKRRKDMLRFLTSPLAAEDYGDSLGDRMTTVGDDNVVKSPPPVYNGVPLTPVALFPENQGTGTDETSAILTEPKNIHVGIWRNIKVETDRDIRAGVNYVVASLRFDMKYANEDAVVKATAIKVS